MEELDSQLDKLLDYAQKDHRMMDSVTYLPTLCDYRAHLFKFEFPHDDELSIEFYRSKNKNEYWHMNGSLEVFDDDILKDFLEEAIQYAKDHPPKPKSEVYNKVLKFLNLPLDYGNALSAWATYGIGAYRFGDLVIKICKKDIKPNDRSLDIVRKNILSFVKFEVTEDAYNCFFNHTSYCYNHKDLLIDYMKQSLCRGYDTVTLVHSDGVYVFGIEDNLIYLVGDKKRHPSLFVSRYNKVLN